MKKILIFILIIQSFALSKEYFTEGKIKYFLKNKNPYVNSIIIEKDIYEGKLKYYQGFFNTKLGGKFENKEYPVTEGRYRSLYLEKPTFQSADFLLGYRKAIGVQEYNNIKTGEKGEIIFGVKLPIINFIKQIDKRRVSLLNTKIKLTQIDFEILDKLRKLYLKIIENYYQILYAKEVLKLEESLLKKAEKRYFFIKRKVKEGSLPKILLIEAKQNILKRKERVLKAKNQYFVKLNEFLKYLNISQNEFLKHFSLPNLPKVKNENFNEDELYKVALKNNLKLKVLNNKKERIQNKLKFVNTLKYPDIKLSAYVVNDFKYAQGYKFSLDFSFYPINNKYLGKKVELSKKLIKLESEKEKVKIELKTKISNLLNKLDTIKQNLKISLENINLLKSIESAEIKKFKIGLSDLFYVNQREIYTLKGMKDYLKYKAEYHITYKKLMLEIYPDEFRKW